MSGNDKRASWTGTWLSGARAAGADLGYPGERLGLPERGEGSAASYARRLVGLMVDWLLCLLVAGGVISVLGWSSDQRSLVALVVFVLQTWLLTGLTGTTIGKRLAGLRVVRLDGRPVGLVPALFRAILLALVVPALLWDRDHRGLHDRVANTAVIEL